MRNDENLCASDALEGGVTTCSTVVVLSPEDTVRVTGHDGDPGRIQTYYSGFAGYLIEAYP